MDKLSKNKVAILSVYTQIEGYPPSLNALRGLSGKFDGVVVVHRNIMHSNWEYPPNVTLRSAGKFVHYSSVASKPFWWKIKSFLQYSLLLRQQIIISKPSWLIFHDPFALLAWYIMRNTFKRNFKPKLWYHNHDIILGNESFLAGWAAFAQKKVFSSLDKFSLPTEERLSFFLLDRLKSKPIIIPNFPSRFFFSKWQATKKVDSVIRIIFQGHISVYNELELIVKILPHRVNGKQLELHLAGDIESTYEKTLIQLAMDLGVKDKLVIHGRLSYINLPALTSSCHIGLAVYGQQNLMVRTMGTASNKIYEYAAVGLPVLLFHCNHLKNSLKDYEWAVFSDAIIENLGRAITDIDKRYLYYSSAALRSFNNRLNFETVFDKIIKELN